MIMKKQNDSYYYALILIIGLMVLGLRTFGQSQTFQADSIPNLGEPVYFEIPVLQGEAPEPKCTTGVTLDIYDTDSDELIGSIPYGATSATLDLVNNFTLVAEPCVEGEVGQVRFFIDGDLIQTENIAPYTISGDQSGDFQKWNIEPGTYELEADPDVGESLTITLIVE